MNLYIIARKDCNHYLANSGWRDGNGFHWTGDIYFAVFSSDKSAMELYYASQLCVHAGDLYYYHVREMTEAENIELIKHQCYHYKHTVAFLNGNCI